MSLAETFTMPFRIDVKSDFDRGMPRGRGRNTHQVELADVRLSRPWAAHPKTWTFNRSLIVATRWKRFPTLRRRDGRVAINQAW